MKTKARCYLFIITISALLMSPSMAQTAALSPSIGNSVANDKRASVNQAVAEDENAIQTTIPVTSKEDNTTVDGLCTLREAVQAAVLDVSVDSCPAGNVSSDTITFNVTGVITLVIGDLDLNTIGGSLVIDGGDEITISGGDSVGVFSVGLQANVTLENLSITAGYAQDGGGIYNNGVVNILNSSVYGNAASPSNGRGGGIYNYSGSVSITNSTLDTNNAAYGGAIYNHGGFVVLTNSTVSGNDALYEGGGIYGTGTVRLYSATVADNLAGTLGGGIYTQSYPLYLRNTILAENIATSNGPDCSSTNLYTYGYNLIGNTAGCGIHPWTGDLTNVDPMLGPLQDNGSSTYTQALLYGSLAIDHGDRNGCTGYSSSLLTTDQRGFSRVNRCDIGAFEWQPEPAAGPYSIYMSCITRFCSSRLYFDDFSNPSSGWRISESPSARLEYINNEYRILAKVTPAWVSSFPGFKSNNYVASVDVRNETGVFGYYGILFSFAPDWSKFYFFVVSPNGYFIITYWNPQTAPWLANGYSNAIHLGTESNRLTLERNGGMIWAYANGELLSIVKDSSFTGFGYIGLITIADPNPNVDARFDNFSVEPITCGASYNYPLPFGGAYGTEGFEVGPAGIWESSQQFWPMDK